jgi:TonB family protein
MQGSVFVVMDVDATGKVTSVEPLACGSGLKLLAEAASEAARGATFSPISIAGQPIRRKAFAMYSFILR